MADRGVWFKLWGICLNDQELQNLSLENWARWVRLGVYIKVHGKAGKIRFRHPFYALIELFRCANIAEVKAVLPLLPHAKICDEPDTVTIDIEFKNWHKYQIDSSALRTINYRKNVTRQEEKRSRREVEEKRGEGMLPSFVSFWKGKTAQERQAGAAQISEGLKAFNLGFRQQDDLYKKIMGEDKNGTVRSQSISEQAAERKRKIESGEIRSRVAEAEAGAVFARVRSLPKIQPDSKGNS